jgi:hypothetical protein
MSANIATPVSPAGAGSSPSPLFAIGSIMFETCANREVRIVEPSFIKGWFTVETVEPGFHDGSCWEAPRGNLVPLANDEMRDRLGAKEL